MLISEN
jgi:hypothetical protein